MADSVTSKARAALLGLAVGDALGVPVEFSSREARRRDPVLEMRGYGTHQQPIGTWSDDSSLTFCLAETLATVGYNVSDAAERFLCWHDENYWTAHGQVFDIGIATADALQQLRKGISPLKSGGTSEYSNGNGSLMRILPLVFTIREWPISERFRAVKEVSGITHAHIRSVIACFIYVEVAQQLLAGLDKQLAYQAMQHEVNVFMQGNALASELELRQFHRILENQYADYVIRPLIDYKEDDINSSGYVVHTLEAALWCLLNHDTYAATVLAAVNLGEDTDTTAAVVGGLAGLVYGEAGIPAEWLADLARRDDIIDLAIRLAQGG
jgi:ADP-ribosyl-[dinitrogen reductase] hydrolase